MKQNVRICERVAARGNLVMTKVLWEHSAIWITPSASVDRSSINITIGLRSLETPLGVFKHVTGLQIKNTSLSSSQHKGEGEV
jgi:hypothetical protein